MSDLILKDYTGKQLYPDDSGTKSSSIVSYRKVNGIVSISINGSISKSGNWETLATLPEGFRPQMYYAFSLVEGTDSVTLGQITTDGVIKVLANKTSVSGFLNYPV